MGATEEMQFSLLSTMELVDTTLSQTVEVNSVVALSIVFALGFVAGVIR